MLCCLACVKINNDVLIAIGFKYCVIIDSYVYTVKQHTFSLKAIV